MKKTLRLALLLFSALCSAQGMAQTFQAVPAPLLESEVAFNQANECIIHFDHPAGTPLQLRWRRLEMSLPNGWDADLCDYGLCYNGVPPNGTMNPITGATQAYLKLIVLPDNVPGVGWFWFRVYEMGNDSNFVDVYFSLHTPGTVGTALPVWTRTDVQIFSQPRPGNCFFRKQYPSKHSGSPVERCRHDAVGGRIGSPPKITCASRRLAERPLFFAGTGRNEAFGAALTLCQMS